VEGDPGGVAGFRQLGQHLRAGVAAADHEDALPRERPGRPVVGGVELHPPEELAAGDVGDVGAPPGSGGAHHGAGAPLPLAGVEREAVALAADGIDHDRAADGDLVALLVARQVVQHVGAGGVLVLAAGHHPAGERGEARGGEEAKRFPSSRPRAAGAILRVEKDVAQPRPPQVVGDRERRLPAADDRDVRLPLRVLHLPSRVPHPPPRLSTTGAGDGRRCRTRRPSRATRSRPPRDRRRRSARGPPSPPASPRRWRPGRPRRAPRR